MQFVKPLNEIGAMPNLLRGFKHMQAEMLYVKPLGELGALPILLGVSKSHAGRNSFREFPINVFTFNPGPLMASAQRRTY